MGIPLSFLFRTGAERPEDRSEAPHHIDELQERAEFSICGKQTFESPVRAREWGKVNSCEERVSIAFY